MAMKHKETRDDLDHAGKRKREDAQAEEELARKKIFLELEVEERRAAIEQQKLQCSCNQRNSRFCSPF